MKRIHLAVIRTLLCLVSHFQSSHFPKPEDFMAKTKATEVAKRAQKAPSVAQLSELAKKFIQDKDKSGKGPSVEPTPEVPIQGAIKTEKLEITEMDLMEADGFDPSDLPFQLKWCNFDKFRAMFKLTEQEACTILLAMVGPTVEGEKIWCKFEFPKHLFSESGVFEKPALEDKPEAKAFPKTKSKQVRSKAAPGWVFPNKVWEKGRRFKQMISFGFAFETHCRSTGQGAEGGHCSCCGYSN